jgi:hypothetical protein
VSDPENTNSASTAGASKVRTIGASNAMKWIRRLMAINLSFVAVQPISAGFLLSAYDHASTIHVAVAVALQLGAFIQGVSAVVLWLRGRVSGWVAGFSIGLFGIVLLEVWAGRQREYWLHVPIGVAILLWLRAQMNRSDTQRRL